MMMRHNSKQEDNILNREKS